MQRALAKLNADEDAKCQELPFIADGNEMVEPHFGRQFGSFSQN